MADNIAQRPNLPDDEPPPVLNLAEFVIHIEAEKAQIDIPLLKRAYEFVARAHAGQRRDSGEPFLNHVLEVGKILAKQHQDTTTIAAGLMHDVVEDTDVTLADIRKEFGEELANLVDGVTKISGLEFKSREELQVGYFRKMLLSMAQDIRVIIIKLADRLHNMRTIEHVSDDRRRRIAEETRDVYAPLAHRFGMARIKAELEDLCFKALQPDLHRELEQKVQLRREERESYIAEMTVPLRRALDREGIVAEIAGRAKHLDSVHRKMLNTGRTFEEIYDLFALRIVTGTERDCYHALGVVHTLWTPVVDRFHDYIATPKSNMYQSIHTSVIAPHGRMVELQIRTNEMHWIAEYGIAAHWRYKEGKRQFEKGDRRMNWLRMVLEWQKETDDPSEFLDFLKTDLFQDEIFVYTPQGRLISLPRGANPIDFAYHVHTEVGHHCSGAVVNGRIVPLDHELSSGDEVRIITDKSRHPSRDWLALVRTPRARSKIRAHLHKIGFVESLALGRSILTREMKKLRKPMPSDQDLTDVARAHNYTNGDSLLAALGQGNVSTQNVIKRLLPEEEAEKRERPGFMERVVDRARGSKRGIKIQNMDNVMFRFANCCQPVPGERVMGYITRGRGITVHRRDCPNALKLKGDPERSVEVLWDVDKDQAFLVRINATLENRKSVLSNVTQAISDTDTNIRAADLQALGPTGEATFVVEVPNIRHLNRVMRKMRSVKGVLAIRRGRGGVSDGASAEADDDAHLPPPPDVPGT